MTGNWRLNRTLWSYCWFRR